MRETLVKTEEFKDSPVGKIPNDWEVYTLGECVRPDAPITYGIVQAGSHVEDGVPYIRTGDMAGDRLSLEGLLRTSPQIAASYRRSEVRTGEIVCAIRATVGKVLEVPPELDGANLTQGTARIAPRENINNHFLLWALRSNYAHRQFDLAVKGTTFSEITLENLRKIYVALPSSRDEQDTIAEILDTVDEAIAQTSSLIAKLKQMKAGLLHDLLTRGLDENGELRDAIAHPEQFKDSPLGQIPKDWEILPLTSLTQYITYGFTNPMPTTKDGPWMITAFDIADGKICYEQARHTSEKAYKNDLTQKSKPDVGDILITKDGTLGRIAVVDRIDICINQSVACLRPLPDTDVKFVVHYLRSEQGQERMLADAEGSTIRHIYITKLARMEVPIPPREEARKISAILDSHNTRIRIEEAYRDKLKLQKQGLMHDLLTGKVRVKNA